MAEPVVNHIEPSTGAPGSCLVWKFPNPLLAASSSIVGGGIGLVSWVLNMTVESVYSRMDPAEHLVEVAGRLGLTDRGAALMTAVDVTKWCAASCEGVTAWATVGVRDPVWAANRHIQPMPHSTLPSPPQSALTGTSQITLPGTINLIAKIPVCLTEAALINAIITITEAKVQALLDHGIDGTGTASDAVCVLCPLPSPSPSAPTSRDGAEVEVFGGPRSIWGARLAQAAYNVVSEGIIRQLKFNRQSTTNP